MKILLLTIGLLIILVKGLMGTANANQNLDKLTLDDGQQFSYQQLLLKHKLTGMSLVVVDDYKIVYTKTAGLKEHGSNQLVDEYTAFSTASISKAVTGTIAVMLAEKGVIDLDLPVSQYLKSWVLPASPLTKNKAITIRHLLTHTAGMTQGGFADFYLGDDIPTLIESLNGQKLPRYNKPISVKFEPETDWDYSGGGYVIAQVAIEDVTGKTLAQLAEEMLFKPLGMSHSTMYQHGHPKFLNNVAKVHDSEQKVIGTGLPICPQIAPSGMWSTALDMAKFVIEYQKALAGLPTKVISRSVAKKTTKIETIKKVGGWSAGWMRFEAQGNLDWFSHGGSNTGTGGHVMGSMEGGRGIMVFMNGPTPNRNPAINMVIDSTVKTLKWHQPLVASKQIPSNPAVVNLVGRYLSPFDTVITIEKAGDKLIFNDPNGMGGGSYKGEMVYMGNGKFALDELPSDVSLSNHPDNDQPYLTFHRKGTSFSEPVMRKLGDSERLPFEVAKIEGFDDTLTAYQEWKKQFPESRFVTANALNRAGYTELTAHNYKAAVTLFRVFTALYPDNGNAFDSLGEAYLAMGEKNLAVINYELSLKLNPENTHAREVLEKLKSQR
jgi:CubicO group peptidase (beta-lactamase class C family)